MKTVILCGGLGTRIREETEFKPKPMIPVGADSLAHHENLFDVRIQGFYSLLGI